MEHPAFGVGDVVIIDSVTARFTHGAYFAPSASAMKARAIGGAHIWVLTAQNSPFKELVNEALCMAPDLFGPLVNNNGRQGNYPAWSA